MLEKLSAIFCIVHSGRPPETLHTQKDRNHFAKKKKKKKFKSVICFNMGRGEKFMRSLVSYATMQYF